ncbi:unnamed protein product [Paramecium pentaurelia]|uniref:WD40-repeat-containing domain n=1 Tax=Paramecium pentaurelia TaxID=43138 RepID=A0A8S1YJE8_9CILI|nr:unnamed protein product [Paramecium pentaurelia]
MILSQTESMLKNIWQRLQESIIEIYDAIEIQDESYLKIINNKINPTDLSNKDLEKLVQIVQGTTLNERKASKDSYLQKLQKVMDWWGKEIKAFNEKLKKEMKKKFSSDITGKQQKNEIKSPSQFNLKPFTYQIIQANSIKQQEQWAAFAINKDCSFVAAACNKLINIYEFKQGKLKLNQVLNQHQNEVHNLNFMKQTNQLISEDHGSILVWSYKNNDSWICSQTIEGHRSFIRCIILNNKEDLFISSSQDNTIKFWVKKMNGSVNKQLQVIVMISFNQVQMNNKIKLYLVEMIVSYQQYNNQNLIKIGLQYKKYKLIVMDIDYALSLIIYSHFNLVMAI